MIHTKQIELKDGATLTLSGNASSQFVLNLTEKLKLEHGSSIVLDGVPAHNVLFNLLGDKDSGLKSGSTLIGTVVAPAAKFKVEGRGSVVFGSLLGGKEVILKDGGRVEAVSACSLMSKPASVPMSLRRSGRQHLRCRNEAAPDVDTYHAWAYYVLLRPEEKRHRLGTSSHCDGLRGTGCSSKLLWLPSTNSDHHVGGSREPYPARYRRTPVER